jgi:hypothetical protein
VNTDVLLVSVGQMNLRAVTVPAIRASDGPVTVVAPDGRRSSKGDDERKHIVDEE